MGPKVCILLLTALLVKTGFGETCSINYLAPRKVMILASCMCVYTNLANF